MIKGHTSIELTNVKTGEVERYEDDNMFTQAIPQMVNFAMTHSDYQGGLTDLYEDNYWSTLMGGLLLFDAQVDNDALYPKAGNKMVGCGALNYVNANPNMTQMGTYNATESDTSQPLTKKFVWDFSTDQANGNILCICLTSYNGGFSGAGAKNAIPVSSTIKKKFGLAHVLNESKSIKLNDSYGNSSSYGKVGETFLNFCLDSENDLIYSFSVWTDKLRIETHKMAPEKFDLFRSMKNVQPGEITEYNGSFSGGSYFFYFYNSDEQVLYFWLTDNSKYYPNNKMITIYKFDMETKTVSAHCNFKNNSGVNIWRNIVFTENFAYARSYVDNNKTYKTKLNDMTTNIISGGNKNSNGVNSAYILNGIITFPDSQIVGTATHEDITIDTTDDELRYTGSGIEMYIYDTVENMMTVPPISSSQIIFGTGLKGQVKDNYATGLLNSIESGINKIFTNTWTPNNYLATINNLSSPVVKTADKTMKITYTITAEGEA